MQKEDKTILPFTIRRNEKSKIKNKIKIPSLAAEQRKSKISKTLSRSASEATDADITSRVIQTSKKVLCMKGTYALSKYSSIRSVYTRILL